MEFLWWDFKANSRLTNSHKANSKNPTNFIAFRGEKVGSMANLRIKLLKKRLISIVDEFSEEVVDLETSTA